MRLLCGAVFRSDIENPHRKNAPWPAPGCGQLGVRMQVTRRIAGVDSTAPRGGAHMVLVELDCSSSGMDDDSRTRQCTFQTQLLECACLALRSPSRSPPH